MGKTFTEDKQQRKYVKYWGTGKPSFDAIDALLPVPLDTYIDVQFEKPLLPVGVNNIGGKVNAAKGYQDIVPPVSGVRQVRHQYHIHDIKVEIDQEGQEYHPYQAMVPNDQKVEVADFYTGFWQMTGKEHNKIRLLGQSPFSYTQLGQPEWFIPEQSGLTAADLFCAGQQRKWTCLDWEKIQIREFSPGVLYPYDKLQIKVHGKHSSSVGTNYLELYHPFTAELFFDEPAQVVQFLLEETAAYEVYVYFYASEKDPETGEFTAYELLDSITKRHNELIGEPIRYIAPDQKPVTRIVIDHSKCDEEKIATLEQGLKNMNSISGADVRNAIPLIQAQIIIEKSKCCLPDLDKREQENLLYYQRILQNQLKECLDKQKLLVRNVKIKCLPTLEGPKLPGRKLTKSRNTQIETKACRQAKQAAEDNLKECTKLQEEINYISFLLSLRNVDRPRSCITSIIRVFCWLYEEDYYYNLSVPSQEAIDADYQLMVDAINKQIVPIWRPNSKYRVTMSISDTVNGNAHRKDFYFGFKTGGPIGHYQANGIEPTEAPEYRLKYYIDYDKSFPNADGRILYAKPLYYRDPKLLLFFKSRYAHHFFQDWGGNERYQLDILIKDPLEDTGTAEATGGLIVDETNLPLAEYFDYDEYDATLANDLQLLQNLADTQQCMLEVKEIRPQQKYLTITAKRLLPLKLYAAVIRNKKNNNANQAAEVHRYNFQTSRYGSFREHIESYLMKDEEGNERKAIFQLPLELSEQQRQRAWQMLQGQTLQFSDGEPDLNALYSDPFDRLVSGLWQVPPMDPPGCTEFNLITSKTKKGAVSLWIRSPEPFNDPKIPSTELQSTIQVIINGQAVSSFKKIFSKDGTQVILMGTLPPLLFFRLQIEFQYLLWNGWEYIVRTTSTITF